MTPVLTFAQAVARRAAADPDGEVLRVLGGSRWTAADLWGTARSWAAQLAERAGRGDIVITAVPAGPEAVVLTTAISALGAVELPLSENIDPAMVPALFARSAAAVRASPPDAGRPGPGPRPDADWLTVGGAASCMADDHPAGPGIDPCELAATDPALIMPTSGTTGRSKAAVLPVGAGIGQADRVRTAMAYTHDDVLLSYFPWHHINARHAMFLPALLSGARVVFTPKFSASRFLDQVRAEGITAFNFMGAVCMMLLAQPPTPRDTEHRLRAAYGGPAPAALVDAFRRRFGVVLRQAYACTELGDVATTPVTDLRPGAAGRPGPDYDVRIVDELGKVLGNGASGEIQVRPRRPGLTFLEYLDDPDATEQAWAGEWFRTRDQGRLDDGWLHFDHRMGDAIRRRGLNIDPHRVEQAALTMTGVAHAAAVATACELTEDEIHLIVVPGEDVRLDPRQVWTHCRRGLPSAMVPRFITVAETLPMNASLKVDRKALRRKGRDQFTWDARRSPSSPEPDRPEAR